MAITVHLELHTDAVLEQILRNKHTALESAGAAAQGAVVGQMLGGYTHPVYDTGALMRDVQYDFKDASTVAVGSTLDYAPYVHDGTSKMAGRAYIRDGVMGAAGEIQQIFEETMKQGF